MQENLLEELALHDQALMQYENEGQELREQLITTARKSFDGGEIDFFRFVQIVEHATEIKINYLDALHRYNQSVIRINHLIK